jgi:hypothetical protein
MDETVRDPAAHYENPDPFICVYVLFGEAELAETPKETSLIEPFMKSVNQHLAGGVQVDYIEIRGFSDKIGEPAAQKATALARAKVIQEILQSQYKDVLANKGNHIVIRIEGDVYVDGQCDQELAKIDPNNYGQTCRLEDSVNKVKEDPIMLQTKHRSAVIKIVGSKQ